MEEFTVEEFTMEEFNAMLNDMIGCAARERGISPEQLDRWVKETPYIFIDQEKGEREMKIDETPGKNFAMSMPGTPSVSTKLADCLIADQQRIQGNKAVFIISVQVLNDYVGQGKAIRVGNTYMLPGEEKE